jgi:hypothetical protein
MMGYVKQQRGQEIPSYHARPMVHPGGGCLCGWNGSRELRIGPGLLRVPPSWESPTLTAAVVRQRVLAR